MFVMLLGGGLYFIYDYSMGYPKKNVQYFTHKQFQVAQDIYTAKTNEGWTAEDWQNFASKQSVKLAPEEYPLPADHSGMFEWPPELADSNLMKSGFSETWRAYTGRLGWNESVEEKPKDQRTVNEQRTFGLGALIFSVVPLFFLIRTRNRAMKVDGGMVTAPNGSSVAISEIKQIDLRKWKTKGLARAEINTADGTKSLRFDGLTYGGFKKEDGEPAEKFMAALLEKFDGEIIEYEEEIEEEQEAATAGEVTTN